MALDEQSKQFNQGVNVMPRAIVVSLTNLYNDLDEGARDHRSDVLRNTTCVWWEVGAEKAQGVEYAFGVVRNSIVSAYKVVAPFEKWPILPDGAEGEGRRAIPVRELSVADWTKATATQWPNVRMFGPVAYAEVDLGSQGEIANIRFS
jgi:hypothetical protein